MHVSGDEMKEISKKYPNGNVKNADKNLKRDVKRIANTINSTNKSKCHEMARFLTSIKGTCYYTSFVQKSLDNYAIKHGRNIESRTINKNFNNHEELNNNANKNIGQSRQSHIYEHGFNKKIIQMSTNMPIFSAITQMRANIQPFPVIVQMSMNMPMFSVRMLNLLFSCILDVNTDN